MRDPTYAHRLGRVYLRVTEVCFVFSFLQGFRSTNRIKREQTARDMRVQSKSSYTRDNTRELS